MKTIKSLVRKVTEQNSFQLPQESFRLANVEINFETESSRISFNNSSDLLSISVLDKKSGKDVTLTFFYDEVVSISVYLFKQKNKWIFWGKLIPAIQKIANYDLAENDVDADENIKFLWDRIPEYLINLK